jgi:hypothetical protein
MDWPTAAIIVTVLTGAVGIVWRIFFNGHSNKKDSDSRDLTVVKLSVMEEILKSMKEDIVEIKNAQLKLAEKDEKTNERIDKLATLTIQHIQSGDKAFD